MNTYKLLKWGNILDYMMLGFSISRITAPMEYGILNGGLLGLSIIILLAGKENRL